jgi:hypothetical protein
LSDDIKFPALAGATDKEVKVKLPNDPNQWVAGAYILSVIVHKAGDPDKTSNEIPFMLAPAVTFPITITHLSPPASKNYSAAVNFNPAIRPEQDAYLLLGSREFKANDHPAAATSLDFQMKDVDDGVYFVRLRIDGADSLLIDTSVTPPVFKATNKVNLP